LITLLSAKKARKEYNQKLGIYDMMEKD